MRTKQALAVVLSLLLAAWPLWSSTDILGTVTNSQDTLIRGINAVPGGSIFDGDTITVANGGTAWLTLAGGGQVLLGRNSQVRLARVEKTIGLDISGGAVTFRTGADAPVLGIVADGTFRPAGNAPAVGQIAFLASDRALFLARQGDWTLAIDNNGASVTIHAGETMEARIVPESALPPPAQQAPPPEKKKKRKALGLILIGGGIIAAGTGIGLGLGSNESFVTFQQKQNAISPVVP